MSPWRTALALFVAASFAAPPALAGDASGEEPGDDDIWKLLDTLPARTAWDLGVNVSYGNIGYWSDRTTPWTGYGIRGTYGWVVDGTHRFGPSVGVSIEGPFPVYMTVAFEPMFSWDRVRGGLLVGASIGPSVLVHSSSATIRPERAVTVAPMASARLGYSKPFSRLGRRFFVVLEPRFRYVTGGRNDFGKPDVAGLIYVGSGRGR